MSVQVFFGRDMILNTPFIADWGSIRLLKQELLDKKQIENKNSKPQTYRIRDKVLVSHAEQRNTYRL